jgi:hypothetical protein
MVVKTGSLVSKPKDRSATGKLTAGEPYGGAQAAFQPEMSAASGIMELYGRMPRRRIGRPKALKL